MEYALDIVTKQNVTNARLDAIEAKLDHIVALLGTLIDNKKVDDSAAEERYEEAIRYINNGTVTNNIL